MSNQPFLYKDAKRLDKDGTTYWYCEHCPVDKLCCAHSTNGAFTKDSYKHKCPKYIGVDEEGLLCAIPNSLEFILFD